MFIKSVVIDGFKSYGHRTEINGFDPAFNAITGLNGSGKSNILDSICFLMGITNLSHVSIDSNNRFQSIFRWSKFWQLQVMTLVNINGTYK